MEVEIHEQFIELSADETLQFEFILKNWIYLVNPKKRISIFCHRNFGNINSIHNVIVLQNRIIFNGNNKTAYLTNL
jgi:hypothetical protein